MIIKVGFVDDVSKEKTIMKINIFALVQRN